MIHKKTEKQIIGYIAASILAYLFLIHGIQAVLLNPGFLTMVTSVGFPLWLAKISLFVVGIIDITVAIALFVYKKPLVLVYAGLWPIVPYGITFFTTGHFSIGVIQSVVLAIVMYWAFIGFGEKRK